MKRADIHFIVSLLLLVSLSVTGVLGYIQSTLELRKFIPHRYFAYTTLCLAALHIFMNGGKIWNYIRGKTRKNKSSFD